MMVASLGGWAAIIAASFWGLLVLALAIVMLNVFRLLESLKMLVDGIRQETIPLLGEVRVTVTSVNQQLEHVEGLVQSAGNIAKSAERLTGVVEQTVSSPLIKVAGFAAGATRAMRRFRKSGD